MEPIASRDHVVNLNPGTVVSIVQENVQQQADYARKEAAHMGLHTTDNCCNDVVADESHFAELMAYRKLTYSL